MQESKKEISFPPPPGIIGSLRTGFDLIATHVLAILPPLALDLLLWMGPRLRMDKMYAQSIDELSQTGPAMGLSSDLIQKTQEFAHETILPELAKFNLLFFLRTFPVGVSSLMSGKLPAQSPFGPPPILQIDSIGEVLNLILLLTLLGWIFGALYFQWIASLVRPVTPISTGRAVFQALVFSMIWAFLTWTVGLPILLVIYALTGLNETISRLVLLVVGFVCTMWLIVPIFFSPYGIFLRKQNAFTSILSSLQVSRFTLPTSSLFVLTVILLSVGLNFVWDIPPDDSWLALVGILGHAFITTALLASSFVYYRDLTVWLQTVLERLHTSAPTQQA